MHGKAKGRKNKRSAVCLGKTSRGWCFLPVTSSLAATWQTPIRQTGEGWTGWDLRYSKESFWCPNRIFYLTDAQVNSAIAEDSRIGQAPQDVVRHGVREMRHAIANGLMTQTAWFEQGLVKR